MPGSDSNGDDVNLNSTSVSYQTGYSLRPRQSTRKPDPLDLTASLKQRGFQKSFEAKPETTQILNGQSSSEMSSEDVELLRIKPLHILTELEREELGDLNRDQEGGQSDRLLPLSSNMPLTPTTPLQLTATELSTKDIHNIALLVVLYMLQGIPIGISFGSIPFLLKSRLSYSEIAVFSLCQWPYSLKLIWSPIVDAIYSPTIGRRKSWILPIQLMTGTLFVYLGTHINSYIESEHINIYYLSTVFFITIFFCATQDVAVDGWALTLLSRNSLSYASTAQTIGINTGYFLSFTIFLALNSAEFCNKYLRSSTDVRETGVLGLGEYITFWGICYFIITIWVWLGKVEEPAIVPAEEMDISYVYRTIFKILRLPHMRIFIIVLLTAKIGFQANEAVTGLKLLEKGFQKEDLALAVLIDFPFQIIFGYYAAKWSSGKQPLLPWLYAFYGRLLFSLVGMIIVYFYPTGGNVPFWYFWAVMGSIVMNSFMSTVQFVGLSAFMTTIADPVIGGTYMTLLNTFSNFGGTWPKFFVLEAVDRLTVATCSVPNPNTGGLFSCVAETGKTLCRELDGICNIERDGYYYVNIGCVTIGAILLWTFVMPNVKKLEALPKSLWRLDPKGIKP